MKDFKYKKQVLFIISLILFICALGLATWYLFFTLNNSSTQVSATDNTLISPDISIENTIDGTNIKEEDIPEVVTDEKASEEELKKEKVTKKEVKKATSPYYIKVNYGANVVTIYKKDANGNYTVPYKAMVCSSGTYTPKSGTYKISSKYRWGKLIHNVYGQYATRIVGSILFHSVPYSSNTNDSLLYNQYDRLGTRASAGCIRLTVRDAKWIYSNCPSGTMVEFYSSSNPGPLGKPSAQKIASNEQYRNWDPTDPVAGNPWHTYNPNKENTESNNTITNNTPIINNTTITDKPNNDKPTTDNPTVDKPNNNEPTIDNPTVDKPNNNEPTTDNPTVDKPNNDKPTTDTPTVDKPNSDEPTTDNPIVDKPNNDEPTTDNPTVDKPVVNGIV